MNNQKVTQIRHLSNPEVTLYADGCIFDPKKMAGNPTGKGRGKRKAITGWSMASRRRMQEVLLTSHFVGMNIHDITLTIPGPLMSMEDSKKLWADYCRRVSDAGLCMIWRIEIQERGAYHWHCIAGSPAGEKGEIYKSLWMDALRRSGPVKMCEIWDNDYPGPKPTVKELSDEYLKLYFVKERHTDKEDPAFTWVKAGTFGRSLWGRFNAAQLQAIEPCLQFLPFDGDYLIKSWPDRSYWFGADKYACVIKPDDGSNSWRRYMHAHSTKCKQAQIAVNIGRHWGIVGRKHLTEVKSTVAELTPVQYNKVRRWMERLATPVLRCPRAPFGRKLADRSSVGRLGKSRRFCDVATIERMINFAVTD